MSRAGVVVVTYNSEAEIGPCLDAVTGAGAEVVVVDNASSDGTRQEVLRRPAARLIANPWNRGFAAAANQGIGALKTSHALLLNPDAVVMGGLEALVKCCEQGAAAAAGMLVDDNGPQRGFGLRRLPTPFALLLETLGVNRLWPGNPVNRTFRCLELDLDRACEAEQPAGAFLMVRRDVWRELGGFDERFYPLWFEDVDFCKRVRDAGYRIHYIPSAVALHTGAHTVSRLSEEQRQLCWYGSLLQYAAKHFGDMALWALCLAVVIRSVVWTFWGIFTWEGGRALPVQARIIRLAGRYLFSGRNLPGVEALPG